MDNVTINNSDSWDNIFNTISVLKAENDRLKQENEVLKERIVRIYEEFECHNF